MNRDFGPLIFQRRQAISVVVFVALLGGLCGFGAGSYLIDGTTYGKVLGTVLALVAVGLGYLAYLLGSQRWEIYRDGVVQYRMGRRSALHFDELSAFAYIELDGGLSAPDAWIMNFWGRRGEVIGMRVQPDLHREKEVPLLNERLLARVGDRLRKELPKGVRWGEAQLRLDGVVVGERKVPYGPALHLETKEVLREGMTYQQTRLLEGGKPLLTFAPGSPNLQIGLRLFEELLNAACAKAG